MLSSNKWYQLAPYMMMKHKSDTTISTNQFCFSIIVIWIIESYTHKRHPARQEIGVRCVYNSSLSFQFVCFGIKTFASCMIKNGLSYYASLIHQIWFYDSD